MIFLTKYKALKFFRYFILIFLLIFLVILVQNIRNLKKDEAEEKTNLSDGVILKLKNLFLANVYKERNSEKEQKEGNIENVNSKASNETSKRKIVFNSEYKESCLRKYLLNVPLLSTDPERVSELLYVAKNVSQPYMFTSFHRITEFLNIKTCIIEPSILHCLLPTKYQKLLTKRNFPLSNLTRSQHIITFGILEEDVPVLQKKENIIKFLNSGLHPYFVQVPLAPWMKRDSTRFKNDSYTSHVFYMHYTWTFHVVVFYKRNNYLWHGALEQDGNLRFLADSNLLFANYDSAYENFSFERILNKSQAFPSIYIPSNPHYFLFQVPSSRFLECNSSRAIYIDTPTVSPNSSSPSSQFNIKTLIALRELKVFFQDLLMNFWIFSGTLLGWYRQCGVIPYTSDVDFGAWKSEIDDLDHIIAYFRENKNLYILERMGLLEEALEFQLRSNGLRVDVFFMYKIDNGTWASGHRPSKGYYFRYHYPFFTLCSAELLKEKVQVPCEAEDLISIEYGEQWMHPVEHWYYESSIHNRGPNIYWDEKRRPKAFQRY